MKGFGLLTSICVSLIMFFSCIGTDLIFDTIDPELRWMKCLDTLAVDDEFKLEAIYLNNVGVMEEVLVVWESSDTSLAEVDSDGVVFGKSFGSVTISTSYFDMENDTLLFLAKTIQIDEETIIPVFEEKSGQIATTSSYLLQGSFTISEELNGDLKLAFEENYKASTALPGLYVYLTNNPNTTSNAYEIGAVTTFNGAHNYILPSTIGINDYQYVLYFCKPFNVKVGDGQIN